MGHVRLCLFIGILLCVCGTNVFSQSLSFPEIRSILDLPGQQVDTLMKNKGFRLMQKEIDSTSALFYYSEMERNDESPTWVRSLTYMDARLRGMSGRLVTYRTYNKEEYKEILAWLLTNDFKTTNSFDFHVSRHTIYSNGQQSVRAKVITNKLKNGRILKSYEFELGN